MNFVKFEKITLKFGDQKFHYKLGLGGHLQSRGFLMKYAIGLHYKKGFWSLNYTEDFFLSVSCKPPNFVEAEY